MNWTLNHIEKKLKAGTIRSYEIKGAAQGKKRNKFGNKKVEAFGEKYDSKKEATRHYELKLKEKAGEITDLERQVEFQLSVCKYICDYRYKEVATGNVIVEDVKSSFTRKLPVYRLKKKLMEKELGITIKEV